MVYLFVLVIESKDFLLGIEEKDLKLFVIYFFYRSVVWINVGMF